MSQENNLKTARFLKIDKTKKTGFDYKIETLNNSLIEDELIDLLIYCGFGANLYMQVWYASLGFAY